MTLLDDLEDIAEEETVGPAHVGLRPQTVTHLPGRLISPRSWSPLPNKVNKQTLTKKSTASSVFTYHYCGRENSIPYQALKMTVYIFITI